MNSEAAQKFAYLICFIVISIAVAGFFTGLQAPMHRVDASREQGDSVVAELFRDGSQQADDNVLPATGYADIGAATRTNGNKWRTRLTDFKTELDPLAEVIVTPEQKAFALMRREQNRAFNGAPPTIPHPAEKISDQSCLACHGEGLKSETLRISKMSHQFLTNCTQCHVESNPQAMEATVFRENSFVGLPAPTGGPRAYEGAPPMIPHSTWMRVECMSCHGFAGQQGIRTTHPWRQNCEQCHASSSALDQVPLNTEPSFLPPPKIVN